MTTQRIFFAVPPPPASHYTERFEVYGACGLSASLSTSDKGDQGLRLLASREKKPTNHYDPAKEASKPQWKKPKKSKDKKPEVKGPVHTIFICSDEDEP